MRHNPGVEPKLAQSILQAKQLLAQEGAVVVTNVGSSAEAAKALMRELFEPGLKALPEPARVFEGGEKDRKLAGTDHHDPLPAHTDGFAYGDYYPDCLLLVCVHASGQGGESFLVDGYAVLSELNANEKTHWVADALAEVPVDQTEEGMQPSLSPIVQHTPAGRCMVRRVLDQYGNGPAVSDDSTNPDRDAAMIEEWLKSIEEAAALAPRFRLQPGQALLVDNYRMFHGREGYADPSRCMWRVWGWSDGALGVPDLPLHSDTRYAYNSAPES